MPQLDIQIFFIDTFIGFFGFWILYFYNNKIVFPEIKRSILLREVKILTWKLFFVEFLSYFKFWEFSIEQLAVIIKQSSTIAFEKKVAISFCLLKKYGLDLFLLSKKSVELKQVFSVLYLIALCKTLIIKK